MRIRLETNPTRKIDAVAITRGGRSAKIDKGRYWAIYELSGRDGRGPLYREVGRERKPGAA